MKFLISSNGAIRIFGKTIELNNAKWTVVFVRWKCCLKWRKYFKKYVLSLTEFLFLAFKVATKYGIMNSLSPPVGLKHLLNKTSATEFFVALWTENFLKCH